MKDVPGRLVAVCDGGMNDLLRPSLYGAHHPVSVLGATDARPRGLVDVVGPVCETGDFFALDRELPLPAPGDLVAIGYAGALRARDVLDLQRAPALRRGSPRGRAAGG